MNRTSMALKRLGVPVLASTLLVTGAQIALGTSAFAAGALTITPNPAAGATGSNVALTITDTGDTDGETVNLTVTGNATFVAGTVTTGAGTNTATKTCPANGGATADVCSVSVTDATAQSVTVTATGADSTNSNTDVVTFSSSTNGTLAITPNPAYGTATPDTTSVAAPPNSATGQTVDQTVTYTPGSQSVSIGTQTITVTVSGSAKIVAPNGAQSAVTHSGEGTQTFTCTTAAAPPQTCNFAVIDSVSEAVTVTAHDATDTTTPNATATDNFAGLWFTNCPQTALNTTGNCVTQQAQGASSTYSVKYLEAGAPAAGRTVAFSLTNTAGGSAFAAAQPAGTTFQTGTTAVCTTGADGTCSVTLSANAAATGSATITAITQNTAPYPASRAQQLVNFVATTTFGRLTRASETDIRPATQADAVNEPGDAVQLKFTATAKCTPATGNNNCTANALASQQLTVTTDHGFFTPNCISSDVTATNNYANCTFDPAAASGGKVGNLKSLGASTTVTTDANGQFTVTLAVGRDTSFDQNGVVVATVSAAASGGSPVAETAPGQGPNGLTGQTACTAPSAGAPEAGCPSGTVWTTVARPLNGASVKIVSVPNTSTEPVLSDTATNNVPTNNKNTRVVVVHLTDQFGNLTSGGTGANAGVTLASTGVADLLHCTTYSNSVACGDGAGGGTNTSSGDATASTPSTDSSGVATRTYTHVLGSYLSAFSSTGVPTQERYEAVNATNTPGTQTLKATWAAPVTTFNTFAAGPPAVATYTTSTSSMSDTVVINWYDQNAQAVATFSTTPSNTVKAGTVVSVSATVKDQFGQPIQGDNVQFIRSGPQTNNGTSCSATQSPAGTKTNAAGQAGFSFTCTNPSTQVVTIVVQDGSGNELARGTQTINFTGTTTSKRTVSAHIVYCKSPSKHLLVCKVQVTPHIAGLQVTLRDGSGHFLGSQRTNHNGVVTIKHGRLKSHKRIHVHARVAGSATTKAATSNTVTVRIR